MKIYTTAVSVSLLLGSIGAFAADSPSSSTAPAPAASAAAPSAASSQAAAAPQAATPASPAKSVVDPETAKQAHSMGLTQKMHNGQIMWCKSDVPLGTKLASYNCIRNDQVAAAAERSLRDKDAVGQMQSKSLTEQTRQ